MSVDDFLGGGFLEDDDEEDGEVLLNTSGFETLMLMLLHRLTVLMTRTTKMKKVGTRLKIPQTTMHPLHHWTS